MIFNRETLHDFINLFEESSGSYEVVPTVSSMYTLGETRFKMTNNSGDWKLALQGSGMFRALHMATEDKP
jgi:hypothetical protein